METQPLSAHPPLLPAEKGDCHSMLPEEIPPSDSDPPSMSGETGEGGGGKS